MERNLKLVQLVLIPLLVIAIIPVLWIADRPSRPIRPPGPIMKCDPQMLTAGIPIDDIKTVCGEPDLVTDKGRGDWYPLMGQRRETVPLAMTLHYGDVMDDKKHVSLYFADGKLRSVQIYGDYK